MTVSHHFLPIKAANTSVVHNSDQLTFQVPHLQDRKLLTHQWCSFQTIVAMRPIAFSHITAANTVIMNNNDQITLYLPGLQHQKSFTLHWRSICHSFIHNMLSCHFEYYIVHTVLAAFLSFSCTHSFITTLVFNNTYIYTLWNIL